MYYISNILTHLDLNRILRKSMFVRIENTWSNIPPNVERVGNMDLRVNFEGKSKNIDGYKI